MVPDLPLTHGPIKSSCLDLLFASGKKGFELGFFYLMPIRVCMMAAMRVFAHLGVLRRVALLAAPALAWFGIPGLGGFAMVRILSVSFAAPVSTFRLMDQDPAISDRRIAAGFAAILCLSQANAAFPLAAFGLNLPVTLLSSVLGGLVAGLLTFNVFARHLPDREEPVAAAALQEEAPGPYLVQVILAGAEEGFQLVLKAVPLLVLAVLMVNVLKAVGAVRGLERLGVPVLGLAGIAAPSVLAIVTKDLAGGTAMMGATIPMLQGHTMSVLDLNRIAGFTINTLDPVGLAILVPSGRRFAACAWPATQGARVGILVRGILHLVIFR
jgi:spore maturation protein SpmB